MAGGPASGGATSRGPRASYRSRRGRRNRPRTCLAGCPRRRGAQGAQVRPRAVPPAPILPAAGARRGAPARGGRGLGRERRGRSGARTELAGARRGGGSPLPGGGGGGVAVALLSRGAAASCGWSRLQRQQPARLPHARTLARSLARTPARPPARRGLALLAIFPAALGRGSRRRGEAEPRERGPGRPRGAVAAVTAAPGPGSLSSPLPPEMRGRCPCQGSRPS